MIDFWQKIDFWLKNHKKPNMFTIKNFTDKVFSSHFVNKIIKILDEKQSLKLIKKRGRKILLLLHRKVKKLKLKYKEKVSPSSRTLGFILNVNQGTAKRHFYKYVLIKRRKIIKPKLTHIQKKSKIQIKKVGKSVKNNSRW